MGNTHGVKKEAIPAAKAAQTLTLSIAGLIITGASRWLQRTEKWHFPYEYRSKFPFDMAFCFVVVWLQLNRQPETRQTTESEFPAGQSGRQVGEIPTQYRLL
jgi:hypothetical protein